MGLDSIVRKAVAIIDKQTTSLQDTIIFSPWIGSDIYGGPAYGSPINMKAIIEEKQILRRLSDGQEISQRATITIPRPIAPNGATDRREPIDTRDKIVLPSGYTGPILFIEGVMDPTTNAPYSFDIVLG
jgi:hypothetical protein